ncbi:MAG: hypothetical protein GY851_16805, partial [bacterium]|nr:hypothetical protein [bacterium]
MGTILVGSVSLCMGGSASSQETQAFSEIAIRIGARAQPVERESADLLRERLTESSEVQVRVVEDTEEAPEPASFLTILLGVPDHHDRLTDTLEQRRIPPLSEQNPGPEGFHVQTLLDEPAPIVVAASVDQRGALYAVGEVLRRVVIHAASVEVPSGLCVRTAPAFEIRGTQYGQSGVAKRLARVRDWTHDETQRVILDYALAGANTFSTAPGSMFDFIKSYGLMTQGGFGANTGGGPPEWEASESIGRTGYVCLSVPEARQAQLERCDAYFKGSPTFDFVKFHGGDGGGCECDRCEPYGLTFIKVVEEMAAIVHTYHPETRVYFTNQKFDDADDQAIFAYLQEKPRDWLWAWGYGPGSDAMSWQPGHRQTHRMDLFRYPGFGPYARYNQEIVHQ